MHVFYQAEPFKDNTVLNANESHHLSRVLRLRKGDQVQVVDGRGGVFTARVEEPDSKASRLEQIISVQGPPPRAYRLHIAISPPKMQERFEWFLEKATEIGIDEITPLIAHRSERNRIHTERAQKILISAMKQSLGAILPVLNPPTPIAELIRTQAKTNLLIAHCLPHPKPHLRQVLGSKGNTTVLIGPEGDFTQEEIELSTDAGAKEISLGNARLRTETAGITACVIAASYYYGEIS